jgi:hypothetical protein
VLRSIIVVEIKYSRFRAGRDYFLLGMVKKMAFVLKTGISIFRKFRVGKGF